MTTVEYQRTSGRQLTYNIRVDDRGGYSIHLGDKQLLCGSDALSAGGRRCAPNKRKAAGALHEAKRAIESLSLMDEF